MRRTLIVMVLLAVSAVAAAVVYQSAARERDYRAFLTRGDKALAAGEASAAVEDYSGAIALRPDSLLAHLRRGETYLQRGDLDAAARDFRTAASLDPSATRPLEQWGDTLYRQQRYGRAAEVYRNRLRLDDRSAVMRYRLGLSLYKDGNLDAAIDVLQQATTVDDGAAEAHYVLGVCLRERGRAADAASAFERAIARAPGLIAAREELADVYGLLGRGDDEIQQLQVLAGLDGGRIERRIAVAMAHVRAGHADLAVLTLATALEQAPDSALVYGALGRVWLERAEDGADRPDALGRSLEALARAASMVSATSDVKTLYGRALLRSGQREAAERVFQQATERFPVDPSAFAEYAAVAEHQEHFEAARSALVAYVTLVKDDEQFPAAAAKIGILSLRLDDPDAAIAWLERSIAAAPDDVNSVLGLLEAYIRAGDYDAARPLLARALELDPANRSARSFARQLARASRL